MHHPDGGGGKRTIPEVPESCHCQRATEQQQCGDVGVQQQGVSQALQSVQGEQAKSLLAQIKTGIKIPAGGGGVTARKMEAGENDR